MLQALEVLLPGWEGTDHVISNGTHLHSEHPLSVGIMTCLADKNKCLYKQK